MSRGRKTTKRPILTATDWNALRRVQRNATLPEKRRRRAWIITYIAQGTSISETSRMLGISRRHCYRYLDLWEHGGVPGLLAVQKGQT